ncbi:efflux RND transporter periplasmic adaptor subunit [Hylemonella gracilis]|uniref:Efflux RND transporter periplasmic adaptor subunit n=1 Tax=Hylemonella gracilis TaxID=80880 RepID=A0A4P6UJT4_9BURK|nr:efflux RND transporter periplasmic adaptor subunit [Hylemonella gracilis]QBK05412.1 efflux RND transporter periplasmic adaptor subunit [Hylemonella gracilis]
MKNSAIALYATAGIVTVAALGWAFSAQPLEVEVAAVDRGHFERAIEEDGWTRLQDRYVVSSPVAARLSRMGLREGDRVQAGDAVAVLTPVMPSLFDERSQREATARFKAAQAAVSAASAQVEHAKVMENEARIELQRTEQITRGGFASPSHLDSARLALEASTRELEAALAAREVAVQEREQAQASLQPVDDRMVAGRPLAVRAPVSGVVLRVPIQSETTVAPGAALLEIGDLRRMEVVAQLLTADAVQAKPGTRVSIERWGGPPLEGRVRRVEPAAFTKVSALGIEEQRVNVLVDIRSPPSEWLAMGDGFRVSVRVITASTDDAVIVPVGALFPLGSGGMAVYVLDGRHARLQPVDIVARNGNVGWVRSGLNPGAQVLVYPPPGVTDGARVAVRRP